MAQPDHARASGGVRRCERAAASGRPHGHLTVLRAHEAPLCRPDTEWGVGGTAPSLGSSRGAEGMEARGQTLHPRLGNP